MQLPHPEHAQVPEAKIVSYLLNESHEEGQPKAKFFARFGFARERWSLLAESLQRHATSHAVTMVRTTPHGTLFVIEGPLVCPDGRSPLIRSVWFVELRSVTPRFVTAYPID